MPSLSPNPRVVVGITGASGAAYAIRLLELLLGAGREVHLVVSEYGRQLLSDEAGVKRVELEELLPHVFGTAGAPIGLVKRGPPPDAESWRRRLVVHPNKDVGAVIASGSFLHEGMVVIPCSSTTLGSIAGGSGSNLLARAVAVTLKERRRLIVCHRETPLNLIDIENYRTLTLAGAIVCPTNPGLYLRPQGVPDLVDFMVGRVLDLLGVEHGLRTRWEPRSGG